MANNEASNSNPTPCADSAQKGRRWCPVLLSNLWQNTKPKMPTFMRVIFLIFQCLLVIVGIFSGIEVYKLDDPWSAPMLNYACIAFGISEAVSMLFGLRKPSVIVD
jgi:hypothetical protein